MSNTLHYFDISWLSALAGPGIRVVLYLRGCKLTCPWCHSPHSWDFNPTLLFFECCCLYCGVCQSVCPNGVHCIGNGKHHIDRSLCKQCGRCVESCPTVLSRNSLAGALALPSFSADPMELFRKLRTQLDLLKRIGGLTIGGGEPLLQCDPLRLLLQSCAANNFHSAVETSGSVPRRSIEMLVDTVDCWLFGLRPVFEDFGSTGVTADWETVSRNLEFLSSRDAERIIIRTPIIPGFTNSPRSLSAIAELMGKCGVSVIELLPFNSHSNHYYKALGRKYPLNGICNFAKEDVVAARDFFANRGVEVTVRS